MRLYRYRYRYRYRTRMPTKEAPPARALGSVLGSVGGDPFARNGAIAEFLKYSLLRRDLNVGTFQIHRLVQIVLEQAMDEPTQRLLAQRAVLAVSLAFPAVEFSNWPLCERLLPQAFACVELINRLSFEFPRALLLLRRSGLYLSERGRYTEAGPFREEALGISEKAPVRDPSDLADSSIAWLDFTTTKINTPRP